MGSENRDLAEAIRRLSGVDDLTQTSFACKVSNIDTTKYTCDCSPVDGSADFKGVRYNANAKKGFVLEPKDGSIVIITVTSQTTAFVSMVSEVKQIYLNGDNEEGLVTVKSLTDKLNNLESKVNDLLLIFGTTWVPVANDGGAALKALMIPPVTTPLVETTKSEIQNNKVKHGSS